jgi:hypothetical protein
MGRPVLYIGETRNAYKVFVRRTNLVVDGRITLKPVTKKKVVQVEQNQNFAPWAVACIPISPQITFLP